MSITNLTGASVAAWPYLVSGGIVLALSLALMAHLTWRPRRRTSENSKEKSALANRLTFLVAVIIGALSARGMGHFFYDKLNFPLLIVIAGGGIFEVTAFTCALRARLNIKDPEVGKAGADGVAVWVIAGLSGFFSAMDAGANEVGLFQLVLPFLAAWLWERGMSIERRRARGGSTIHWRVTPERILVALRIAEPSGRTASEVDAHRRLTRVSKAAAKLRALRRAESWDWRIALAERRLERAMQSAVAHAGLAQDPARQSALIAQIGSLYNAAKLAELAPDAPWAGFATPTHRTLFEALGVPFVQAEVLPPETPAVGGGSSASSGDKTAPPVGDSNRQNDDGSGAKSNDATGARKPPVGDDNKRQEDDGSGDNDDKESGDKTPEKLPPSQRQPRPRSRSRAPRKRGGRRSMTEWVEVAGPVFHSEFERLQRQPTGDEFAEAIKKAGLGSVSASTAKNIRLKILDRAPLPSLD